MLKLVAAIAFVICVTGVSSSKLDFRKLRELESKLLARQTSSPLCPDTDEVLQEISGTLQGVLQTQGQIVQALNSELTSLSQLLGNSVLTEIVSGLLEQLQLSNLGLDSLVSRLQSILNGLLSGLPIVNNVGLNANAGASGSVNKKQLNLDGLLGDGGLLGGDLLGSLPVGDTGDIVGQITQTLQNILQLQSLISIVINVVTGVLGQVLNVAGSGLVSNLLDGLLGGLLGGVLGGGGGGLLGGILG